MLIQIHNSRSSLALTQAVTMEYYNTTNKYAVVQNIPEFTNNTKIPDDDHPQEKYSNMQ